MKKEWLKKPIQERIEWYKNELESLSDYLADKNHFSNQEKTKCVEWLRKIKDRGKIDDKIDSSHRIIKDKSDNEKQYYRLISKVYTYLPNLNSHPGNWYSELYDAQYEISYYLHSRKK